MLFDSSLRKDLWRTFSATLIVILTIVLTMFLIRMLGQAAIGSVAPQDVVLLLGYTAMGHLSTMLSLSLFIAVVLTLGRMYRDSEVTVWLASGIGLKRFVAPILTVGTPVLLTVAALTLWILPWTNQQSAQIRARYENRSDLSRVAPGQFQTSRDGSRVFFIDRDTQDEGMGRNVFILSKKKQLKSVTSAGAGHTENIAREGAPDNEPERHFLILSNGQSHDENLQTGEKTVSKFETYKIKVGERARGTPEGTPPKSRSTLELMSSADARALGELTWRVGLFIGAANLMVLGIGLSATKPRRANSWNLLMALLAFVVYYNLISLSQAWVANGKISIGAMLITLHGGAFLVSWGLLWWRDHGTHFSLGKRLALNKRTAFKKQLPDAAGPMGQAS
jgi:lipopolysaccharide export system permease protein